MHYLIYSSIALLIGFILDLCFGDPHFLWHPVRFIGIIITKSESLLRKIFKKTQKGELLAGFFLVIIVLALGTILPLILLFIAYKIHSLLGLLLESIMCYQLLATKSLKTESMLVYKSLKTEDIISTRKKLSMIVGRDTANLNIEGIIKATVETIAENTSDGIIAPLFFIALAGAPLGFMYKCINTMDSMIGYQNEKYLYFGRIAAKLDDFVNYIPSRISALLMIISCPLLSFDTKNAFTIFKRDRYNHKSPNSAQTEAVVAGALDIELAGDAYYFNKLVKKKTIGDNLRTIEANDIIKTNKLLYVTAILGLLIFSIIKIITIKLLGGF